MEPCLSGQGKTLMMVHVGPEQKNTHETICALRFARQVSQCDTGGKPKRHVKAATSVKVPSAMTPTSSSPMKKSGKGLVGTETSRNSARRATCDGRAARDVERAPQLDHLSRHQNSRRRTV